VIIGEKGLSGKRKQPYRVLLENIIALVLKVQDKKLQEKNDHGTGSDARRKLQAIC
jgi:hypothetical protein